MVKLFNEVSTELTYETYSHSYICRNSNDGSKWFINRVCLPETHIKEICENYATHFIKPIEPVDFEQESSDNVYQFNGLDLVQQEQINSEILGHKKEEKKSDSNVIGEFTIETAEDIPSTSKIDFLIHVFEAAGEKQLLFTKHQSTTLIKKKFFTLSENEFKELEKDNLYLFNTDITCAFLANNYYIFSIKNFCGLFKYWTKLKEVRDEIIQDIKNADIVSNFDEYNDTYQKFYNMKSIIKIKEASTDIKKYVSGNKDLLAKVCTENSLSLEFNKNKETFTIMSDEGVTVLNRILSGRSGHHLNGSFITFPSFKRYEKQKKKVLSKQRT